MLKRLASIVCLVLMSVAVQAAPLPDLTILEVKSGSLDKGEIWVHIKNIGNATSAPSAFHVFLDSAVLGSDPNKITLSWPHPGLTPGKDQWVLIKTKYLLSQVKYGIRVNGQAQIKESNFSNNSKVGQFGGKP
jgi:CARDB